MVFCNNKEYKCSVAPYLVSAKVYSNKLNNYFSYSLTPAVLKHGGFEKKFESFAQAVKNKQNTSKNKEQSENNPSNNNTDQIKAKEKVSTGIDQYKQLMQNAMINRY